MSVISIQYHPRNVVSDDAAACRRAADVADAAIAVMRERLCH